MVGHTKIIDQTPLSGDKNIIYTIIRILLSKLRKRAPCWASLGSSFMCKEYLNPGAFLIVALSRLFVLCHTDFYFGNESDMMI